MRTYALALAAISILPLQVGCDFESFAESSDRYREDFQYSKDLKPGGVLSVENFNGGVEIMSWEKDSVQITGTKYASRQDDLNDIKIDVQSDGASVRIRTVRPSERRGNMGARYFIRVPRQVVLERIQSSNGQIRVEDIQGSSRLETSNGAIRFRRLNGRLDAKTSNATIEGGDLEGDVVVRTSNGTIRLDHIAGALEAATTNAGVHIDLRKPKPRTPIRVESSNGSIELVLAALEDNEIRATTSNASITLRVPPTLKAQLRAGTSNSTIQTDIDVVTRGSISKTHLEGDINGGGPLIQLNTSNGSIRVLRL